MFFIFYFLEHYHTVYIKNINEKKILEVSCLIFLLPASSVMIKPNQLIHLDCCVDPSYKMKYQNGDIRSQTLAPYLHIAAVPSKMWDN